MSTRSSWCQAVDDLGVPADSPSQRSVSVMRVNVAVMGYVTEAEGRVLLIQRDDTRTWAPPAGGLRIGESPEAGVEREVFEETGIQVRPERLAAVELRLRRPHPLLVLSYRCTPLGGELRRSAESVDVAFASPGDLPARMLASHRHELTVAAAAGDGLVPYVVTSLSSSERLTLTALRRLVYPVKNFRHRVAGTPYRPPSLWNLTVQHHATEGPCRVIHFLPQEASISLLTSGAAPA